MIHCNAPNTPFVVRLQFHVDVLTVEQAALMKHMPPPVVLDTR